MRVLIQRVNKATVTIDNQLHSEISDGLLIFLGIHKEDSEKQASWLAKKCVGLRIFEDDDQKLNRSIEQIGGEILIISQFTLYGNCHEGRRPEFTQSAKGSFARKLYVKFIDEVQSLYPKVKSGVFGEDMKVSLINDGPVTFMIEK